MSESSVVDPCNFGIDPDPRIHTTHLRIRIRIWLRILLFSSVADKIPTRISFLQSFLLITLWRYIYISFHRWKVKKNSQNRINQDFSYFFALWWKQTNLGGPKTYRFYWFGSTTLLESLLRWSLLTQRVRERSIGYLVFILILGFDRFIYILQRHN
jgi:hypothetical protein